jgi:predicted lipoprotein with Yx(FWY)xxD motif
MRRTSILLAATALLATGTAAVASASSRGEKLQLRRTGVGTILVNGRSRTVYAFTRDSRNKDACQGISGCLHVWPPVTSAGKPIAGSGIKSSLLGTITIKGGAKQVTYAGHPLYTYSGDSGPGQTGYVNFSAFGGRWPALNASGNEVK